MRHASPLTLCKHCFRSGFFPHSLVLTPIGIKEGERSEEEEEEEGMRSDLRRSCSPSTRTSTARVLKVEWMPTKGGEGEERRSERSGTTTWRDRA